jgi:hypothetical protein
VVSAILVVSVFCAFGLAVNRTRPTPMALIPPKLFFTVSDLYIFGGIGDFSGFGVPALLALP